MIKGAIKLSLGFLVFTFSAVSSDAYKAHGIVKKVEAHKVELFIKSDECYGIHKLKLPKKHVEIHKGDHITFIASGNPCKKEDVQIIRLIKEEEKFEREES